MKEFSIGNVRLDPHSPSFVIAEIGVNHNGSLQTAEQLIRMAKEAGADAVKFQTFKAEELVTAKASKARYQSQNIDNEQTSQYQMLKELEISLPDFRVLKEFCKQHGVIFLSSPFDYESATFLARELNIDAIKIPSGELNNLPFLEQVAKLNKPIILSTGMSSLGEVEEAINTIEAAGNRYLAILHCVSNYPASFQSVNLRVMETLDKAFPYLIGFSDHTTGKDAAIAAVALGARILEKHLTLDRAMPGPDHKASLEPDEFHSLISGIRNVELALGTTYKAPQPEELEIAKLSRKGLVAAVNITAGSLLTRESINIKRPAEGLPPSQLEFVIGLRANKDILVDEPITLDKLHSRPDR